MITSPPKIKSAHFVEKTIENSPHLTPPGLRPGRGTPEDCRRVAAASAAGADRRERARNNEAKSTTKTKSKTKKKKKAGASVSRTPVFDPATVTKQPLGSRVPCLGCGTVLAMLPSRHAPEYCDHCVEWCDKICDTFDRLQNGTDRQTSDEKELQELWEEKGGDPSFLQETREQWNAAEPSFLPPQTSASTSFPSSSSDPVATVDTANKKKKKKRKKRANKVVITIKEDDADDDDDDGEETDPRQLGWEECTRRGRECTSSSNTGFARGERGRPLQRKL